MGDSQEESFLKGSHHETYEPLKLMSLGFEIMMMMMMMMITIPWILCFLCAQHCSKSFTCINPGRLRFKSQLCHSLALSPSVSVVLLVNKDTASAEVTLVLHAHNDSPQFTANLRVTSFH